MIALALLSLTLAAPATPTPPEDPEAAFAQWFEAEGFVLLRTACDVDETLGTTCYGVDETLSPVVVVWDGETFSLLQPIGSAMDASEQVLADSALLDCALALSPPNDLVTAAAEGDRDAFDAAVELCAGVEETLAAEPTTDPTLMRLVVAVNDELASIVDDLADGVDLTLGSDAGRAHIDLLTDAWTALSEVITGS